MNKILLIKIINHYSKDFDNSIAFKAACNLVFEGKNQPSGYTEPVLHKKRLEKKYQIKINANIFLFNFFYFLLKILTQKYTSLKKYLNNNKDYKDINRAIYI